MTKTGCHGVVSGLVMVLLLGAPSVTRAQTYGEEAEQPGHAVSLEVNAIRQPHLRTTDSYVSTLVKAGAARSATLRKLLAQLDASDVVVYVRIDKTLPAQLDGRTWFVAAAAGIRYVEIGLRPTGQALSSAALFAHELAHAIEVASDPAIVDPKSMAERFLSIGTARRGGTRTFVETGFALGVGASVQRELTPWLADLAATVR